MMRSTVQVSIEIPREMHRRLHEIAARKGISARKLILTGIERALEGAESLRPKRRLALDPPLIKPAGRRITISNREAYDLIEFP